MPTINMNTRIEQIWSELEADATISSGLLVRRYSAELSPDIFAALRTQGKRRCLAYRIDNSSFPVDMTLVDFRDMVIEMLPELSNPEKSYLLIILVNNDLKDIFSVLCEDLIGSVSKETDEKKVVAELLSRMEKWHALLEKAASPGLKGEAQRGLFGELHVLNKMLHQLPDRKACLQSWIGATGHPKDFQGIDWAVEVKTCLTGNHHKIQINGERQLDTRGLDFLVLYQIILERVKEGGISLNQLVDELSENLKDDFTLLTRFRGLLAEAGYFDHHRDLYAERFYEVKQENCFEVKGEFPRIQPDEIRTGVSDLRYTLNAVDCLPWNIPETELFDKIS